MRTQHRIHWQDARQMCDLDHDSVNLVVTSPPYPMIEMWDELFFGLNPKIRNSFRKGQYTDCFRLMHAELNACWQECARVLKPGGIACINIGDATRTLNGDFQLWPNHAEISQAFVRFGLQPLPIILWRKSTNKPNKFMGSGMLPSNAYVTLEHEYILIFRKEGKRAFSQTEKTRRYESAMFWEERNQWFSDVWLGLAGIRQEIESAPKEMRDRSAAFPLTLAMRLVSMFSIYEDRVLDPFWGTGTTSLACMLLGRNSVGYELDPDMAGIFHKRQKDLVPASSQYNAGRLKQHRDFVSDRDKPFQHENQHYGFRVVTSQEKGIRLHQAVSCHMPIPGQFEVQYTLT